MFHSLLSDYCVYIVGITRAEPAALESRTGTEGVGMAAWESASLGLGLRGVWGSLGLKAQGGAGLRALGFRTQAVGFKVQGWLWRLRSM